MGTRRVRRWLAGFTLALAAGCSDANDASPATPSKSPAPPPTVSPCVAVQREWDQVMAAYEAAQARRDFTASGRYLDDLDDIDRRGTALRCPGPAFAPE